MKNSSKQNIAKFQHLAIPNNQQKQLKGGDDGIVIEEVITN